MPETSPIRAFGPTASPRVARPVAAGRPLTCRFAFLGLAYVVLTAAPTAAGDLTIEPSIEFRESFSDNVDLDPEESEESALISEVIPGLRVRSESARLTGALDAFPVVRHQTAGEDKGISFDADLTGLGNMEFLEDLFFVDAQASVSQQVLDNRQAASSANQDTVQIYRISPYLQNRFGGFADGEIRYRLSQVLVDQDDPGAGNEVSDSTGHQVSASISSGDDFTRLFWRLSSLASEEDRTEDDDVSRREVDLELRYAVDRSIALIAGGGYQVFDDGDPENDVDGPTWRVGFHWRPGPRTDLEATFGRRDDDENANVDFSYKIGPRTTLTARYSDVLETSQERLVGNIASLGLEGETNNFIDQDTGDPFDPNRSPFDIDNETVRVETFEIGLNGVRGRNSFGVNASFANEETEPTGEEEDVLRTSVRFSRRLNPHLTGNLFAGYERTEFDDGQEDDEYIATGELSYQLYSNLRTGLEYGFRLQNSNVDSAEFLENRVTVSARITF